MDEKKIKFGLMIHPDTLKAIDKMYTEDNCRCRSEFIEKAVTFYCGYLTSEKSREYLPNVVISTMKSSLDGLENRMARMLFKMAVELSMVLHVTAASNDFSNESLSRLKGMCIEEVKSIQGAINFEDAAKFQKG